MSMGSPKNKPQYGEVYHVMVSRGKRVVLKQITDDGVVEVPHHTQLPGGIYRFSQALGMDLTLRSCQVIAEDWIEVASPVPEPKYLSAKSDKGLTFRRLDFDYIDIGFKCPLFDAFVERLGPNGRAFMAWIGSTQFEDSDLSQYPYLQGDGNDGKSAFIFCLENLFGQAFLSTQPPQGGGQRFWTKSLLGKRLVAFADVSMSAFPSDPVFKMLTGGDAVTIEGKGEDSYSGRLKPKFLFSSNEPADLSPQACDLRRVIYCPMEPFVGEDDPNYKYKLLAEAPHWFSKCRTVYLADAPHKGIIPVDEDMKEEASHKTADEYEYLIEKHLVVEDGAQCFTTELIERFSGINGNKYSNNKFMGKFYSYLFSHRPVVRKRDSGRKQKLFGAKIRIYNNFGY